MLTATDIIFEMVKAEEKAWKSLAGYKFFMFGYHAAHWVNLNRLLKKQGDTEGNVPNPFRELVKLAKAKMEQWKK